MVLTISEIALINRNVLDGVMIPKLQIHRIFDGRDNSEPRLAGRGLSIERALSLMRPRNSASRRYFALTGTTRLSSKRS
jgi:hypothetical protein